jgi:hypothetical protein
MFGSFHSFRKARAGSSTKGPRFSGMETTEHEVD